MLQDMMDRAQGRDHPAARERGPGDVPAVRAAGALLLGTTGGDGRRGCGLARGRDTSAPRLGLGKDRVLCGVRGGDNGGYFPAVYTVGVLLLCTTGGDGRRGCGVALGAGEGCIGALARIGV